MQAPNFSRIFGIAKTSGYNRAVRPALTILAMLSFVPINICAAEPPAKHHRPRPSELASLFDSADKLEIISNPELRSTIIYSSTDPKDIDELKVASAIKIPDDSMMCLCMPVAEIRLYKRNKLVASIGVMHWTDIHYEPWDRDVSVSDIPKWLKWFDERNISEPRREVEEQEARAKAEEAAMQRWISAMPSGLRDAWNKAMGSGNPLGPSPDLFLPGLATQFPVKKERIRALFTWYGAGMGPWSGFPSYEETCEELLLKYETKDLLAALDGVALTDQQSEGAARLFAGWTFNSKRPNDNALIPAELQHKLLEHSLKSTDEDKIGRARAAFEH